MTDDPANLTEEEWAAVILRCGMQRGAREVARRPEREALRARKQREVRVR